jgi:hypothetical protein
LSDVGQNEPKKEIKRRLTAGLDKVGFIEAQALAWVCISNGSALKLKGRQKIVLHNAAEFPCASRQVVIKP